MTARRRCQEQTEEGGYMAVFLLVGLVAGLFLVLCLWKPVSPRQVKTWFVLVGLLGTLLAGAAAFSC